MQILVLILAPLGDTLFTTPALKALRNGYPGARIDVMTYYSTQEILTANSNIDNLIIINGKNQIIPGLKKIRNTGYDLAVGLSNLGSYLNYFVKAHKKIGFKSDELGRFYDFDLPDDRDIHAVDYCLEMVKTVGAIPDNFPRMEIFINGDDHTAVLNKLIASRVNLNLPLILIHPGGKYFTLKRWPAKKFLELIKKIDQKYQSQQILIGGENDRELARQVIDCNYHYKQTPVIFTGELNIKETAALLDRAGLFIGNDSAPQHLAAARQVPVIALFGPSKVANYYPYGTTYKIVQAKLGCCPCFSWLGNLKQYLPEYLPSWASSCEKNCMNSITVADVFQEIESFLTLSGEKKKEITAIGVE
ncbi:MAG: glycosyltransferase family 9 protein [Firmicutes bacterium]|nr:glycosyltransferase family 9 protein [Bacillota bacterium]